VTTVTCDRRRRREILLVQYLEFPVIRFCDKETAKIHQSMSRLVGSQIEDGKWTCLLETTTTQVVAPPAGTTAQQKTPMLDQ
jgi:hypothetical protein